MPSPSYINPDTTKIVTTYIEGMKNPVAIKNIAKNTHLTRRKVYATCMNHPNIVQVGPSSVGCGREYKFFEYKL